MRKVSLKGKESSVIGQQTPLLLIFLIEYIIERITIRQSPLIGYELRRNLHGQIRATLIVVSPSRNIAANLVTTYFIKLSRNFRQCVTLKVKLTSRIRRLRLRFLVLPQCAKGPLLRELIVNRMPGGTFGVL
jgi:hypothetical protein